MQKITLLGNLGKDPEERFTKNQNKVISFSLAVSPRKNQTVWYECQLWGKRIELFENMLPYLKKGSRVLLCGDFHTPESYLGKDGTMKIRLRCEPNFIHFVGAPKEGSSEHSSSKVEEARPKERTVFEGYQGNEEIPF